MLRKILYIFFCLGLIINGNISAYAQAQVTRTVRSAAARKVTPREAIMEYAKRGNIQKLQQMKARGYNIDLADAKGNSSLCEAVWRGERNAVATLIRMGANQNSECMKRIPQNYKQAVGLRQQSTYAQRSNQQQSRYAQKQTSLSSQGSADRYYAGTEMAEEEGLSTAAKVGIGVGAVALVGGGIALAASGGGGGSSSKDSSPSDGGGSTPTPTPTPTSCAGVDCGSHGYCSSGVCICSGGYSGPHCEYGPCPSGTPTGADPATCQCPVGTTEVGNVCVTNEYADTSVVALPEDTTVNSTKVGSTTTYEDDVTVSTNYTTSDPTSPAIYAYGGSSTTENTVAVNGNTTVSNTQGMAILASENSALTNSGTVTLAPFGYGITATNGASASNTGTVTNDETNGSSEVVVGMIADGLSSDTSTPSSGMSIMSLPSSLLRRRATAYNRHWIHFFLAHPSSIYYGMRALHGGKIVNDATGEISFEFEPGTATGVETTLVGMNADGVYTGELSETEVAEEDFGRSVATNNGTISLLGKGLKTHDLNMYGMTATNGGKVVNNGNIYITPDNLTALIDQTRYRSVFANGMVAKGIGSEAYNKGNILLSNYKRYYSGDTIIAMYALNGGKIVNESTATIGATETSLYTFMASMLATGTGSTGINQGTLNTPFAVSEGASILNDTTGVINLNSNTTSNGNRYGMYGSDSTEGTHVSLQNDGTINIPLTVDSLGKYYGMRANSNGSTLTNNGTIAITESGGAQATPYAMYGNILENNGSISLTTSSVAALGGGDLMYTFGTNDYRGSAVNNENKTISISGDHIRGWLMAGGDYTDLVNNGTLSYGDSSNYGKVEGYNLVAMSAKGASTVLNNNVIEAYVDNVVATSYSSNGAIVWGMSADDSSTAKTTLTNAKTIDINLTNQLGIISGLGMDTNYGPLTNNAGATITVTATKDSESATSGNGGSLTGMETGYGTIVNNGTITINSDYTNSTLKGINKTGSVNATPNSTNNGTITLTASGNGTDLYGMYGSDTNSVNEEDATITVSTTGKSAEVYGIYGHHGLTDTNKGTVTVSATGGESAVYGVKSGFTDSYYGTANNTETGTITVTASGNGNSYVYGLWGSPIYSTNSGQITVNTAGGSASYVAGARIRTNDEGGNISVLDRQSKNGSSTVYGMYANNAQYSYNRGTIDVNSNFTAKYVYGAYNLANNEGDISLTLVRNSSVSSVFAQNPFATMYAGINSNLETKTVNKGTITVIANNELNDVTDDLGNSITSGWGLFGILKLNNSPVENYGDISVSKLSPYNLQLATGVAITYSASFYNGFKDEGETQPAEISVVSNGAGPAYGVYVASDTYTKEIINDGTISVIKNKGLTSSGAVRGITNGGDPFNVVNNGTIIATNNGSDGASGIFLDSTYDAIPSQVVNNGTITVNATGGGKAYGIRVTAPSLSSNAIALKNISNTGTITVNATNADNTSVEAGKAYGIYASGRDVRVYNTGTITVNGNSKTGSAAVDVCDTGTCYYVNGPKTKVYTNPSKYVKGTENGNALEGSAYWSAPQEGYYTTFTGSGTSEDPYVLSGFVTTSLSADGFNHIYLEDGATFIDGGFTSMGTSSVNFDALTNNNEGNYAVTTGFSMQTPAASGSLQVDSSAVEGSNAEQFVIENAFISDDLSNLNLVSNSYLFDASLQARSDTTHDIVMTMKSFDSVTDNKSLANFLSNNYALGNNEAFFNEIKSIGNASAFKSTMDSLTGQDTISRFAHEDLTAM
ncbi:MAG: hypothetical protein J6Y03_01625, partial [Alphaproteobacteria bacterium]|nr:hypothetical protein [Alphaproteobacteria bacterium]